MSDFITLTCPVCGGRLEITEDIDRFVCVHCGTEHVVKRGRGIVSLSPVLQDVSRGVDSTASELAVTRLDKEIAQVEDRLVIAKKKVEDVSFNKEMQITLPVSAVLVSILGIAIWVFGDVVCMGVGLLTFALVAILVYFWKMSKEEVAKREKTQEDLQMVKDKLDSLKSERRYHREKLNRE